MVVGVFSFVFKLDGSSGGRKLNAILLSQMVKPRKTDAGCVP